MYPIEFLVKEENLVWVVGIGNNAQVSCISAS